MKQDTSKGPSTSRSTEPFVGRRQQMAELRAIANTVVTRRQGTVVFVSGETGVGKTTLCERFSDLTRQHYPNMNFSYVACSEKTSNIAPYTPFIKIHQDLIGQEYRRWQEAPNAGSWLKDYARQLGPDFFSLVPIGGPILSILFGSAVFIAEKEQENSRRLESFGVGDPLAQANIFQRFTHSLRLLAAQAPLLIFADDWHWADESSTNLLFHLSRQINDVPMLLLVTFRDHEALARRHSIISVRAEMLRYKTCHDISLVPHEVDAVRTYLAHRFPGRAVDGEFAQWLHQVSSGNALFFKEYVELLTQQGHLPDHGQISANVQQLEPPTTVESVIESRLRMLDDESHSLLAYASVEGEHFSAGFLERVIGSGRLALLKQLKMIEKVHRLISELPESANSKLVGQYRFVHYLVRVSLYHSLGAAERRELGRHLLAFREELYALAELEDKGNMLPKLIESATEAMDYFAVAKYALDAIKQARDKVAFTETSELTAVGLTALDRLRRDQNTDRLRAELLLQKGVTAWWSLGDQPQATEATKEALAIAKALRDQELTDSAYLNLIYIALSFEQVAKAKETLAAAMAEAGENNYLLLAAASRYYEHVDDYEAALNYARKGLVLAETEMQVADVIASHLRMSTLYAGSGQHSQAMTHANKSLELASEHNNLDNLRHVYNQYAHVMLKLDVDNYDTAIELLNRAIELNEGWPLAQAVNYHNLASIHRRMGQRKEALAIYSKVCEIRQERSDLRNLAITWWIMGEVAAELGDGASALDYYEKAVALAERIGLAQLAGEIRDDMSKSKFGTS